MFGYRSNVPKVRLTTDRLVVRLVHDRDAWSAPQGQFYLCYVRRSMRGCYQHGNSPPYARPFAKA